MNPKAFFDFTYGLFVLTSKSGEKESGCIINTAGLVTDDPKQIQIVVNNSGYTCSLVKESGKFNISILDESAPFDLFKHFGFQSGRNVDKFKDFADKKEAANGIYYITQGTNAWMSAEVVESIDLGTHTMFIAKVTEAEVLDEKPSVTYNYYQKNIKPKPQAPKEEGKVAWICTICGFVYDNPVLPPDYVCPLCAHPASYFEKIIK